MLTLCWFVATEKPRPVSLIQNINQIIGNWEIFLNLSWAYISVNRYVPMLCLCILTCQWLTPWLFLQFQYIHLQENGGFRSSFKLWNVFVILADVYPKQSCIYSGLTIFWSLFNPRTKLRAWADSDFKFIQTISLLPLPPLRKFQMKAQICHMNWFSAQQDNSFK